MATEDIITIDKAKIAQRHELVRRYSSGELSWHDLRMRGINRYTQVMADLRDLGLPVPLAALEGNNIETRKAGIARLENFLGIK